MAKRYLGYGYTNAQGIAKLEFDADGEPLSHSYTGVGAGKIDIVAESGSLQSETYSILDAIYYDDCSTDTKSKYYINNADGTAKSYENNSIKVVCGTNSSRNYLFLRTQENSGLLASLQGNTVKFKCDITGLNGKTVRAQIRYNASTSSGYTSITSDGTIETNSLTIPSDATNVSFEIIPQDWSSGDTYYCKNFTVYPV